MSTDELQIFKMILLENSSKPIYSLNQSDKQDWKSHINHEQYSGMLYFLCNLV